LIKRNRDNWSIFEALVIGASSLVVYLVFLFLAAREFEFRLQSLGLSEYQTSISSNVLSLTCTILVVVTAVMLIRKQNLSQLWRTIGWNWTMRSFAWALLAGALLAILFNVALTLVYGSAGYFRDVRLPLSLTLYLLSAVLLQPLVEEVYFRGVLFAALARRFSAVISMATVTLAFILMHPGHRLDVLSLAIALGIARLATNSVASCFVLHASYNFSLALYQVLISR
jgi:membrane protease YdiL (CAAX protease family)